MWALQNHEWVDFVTSVSKKYWNVTITSEDSVGTVCQWLTFYFHIELRSINRCEIDAPKKLKWEKLRCMMSRNLIYWRYSTGNCEKILPDLHVFRQQQYLSKTPMRQIFIISWVVSRRKLGTAYSFLHPVPFYNPFLWNKLHEAKDILVPSFLARNICTNFFLFKRAMTVTKTL